MGPTMPFAPTTSEIVASGHHFGMATATTEEFDFLEFSLARDATMRGYYKGWDTPFDANRVLSSWQRGEVPVMTWESRALAFSEDDTDYSLSRIIDGDFDDYLTQYARDINDLGLPLVIRFDQEMNGNWYRWAEFDAPYGNEKGDFIAAWRHVHDVFESVGANEHVVWLWSPNRVDNLTRFPSIDNYYPGRDYVDWVGMTGYHRPGDRSATFSGTYDKTLAELRRVAPGVPIMLAEIGATETGGQKVAFMESLFPGLAANPDIVGFIWFNYAISEKGVTNDWRLDSSSAVFDAFSTGLADSTFGRERGKRFVLVPRTASEPPTTSTTSTTTRHHDHHHDHVADRRAPRPRPARPPPPRPPRPPPTPRKWRTDDHRSRPSHRHRRRPSRPRAPRRSGSRPGCRCPLRTTRSTGTWGASTAGCWCCRPSPSASWCSASAGSRCRGPRCGSSSSRRPSTWWR